MKKLFVIIPTIIGILALLFIVLMLTVYPGRKKEGFRLLSYELGEGTRPGEMVYVEGGELIPGIVSPSFYVGINLVTQEEYTKVMGNNPSAFSREGVPVRPHLPVENVTWYNVIEYCNRLSINHNYDPCYSYVDENQDYGTNPDNWPQNWNKSWETHEYFRFNTEKNGFRLPDRIEWEYAARGGIPAKQAGTFNNRYAGTDNLTDLPDYAWFKDNSGNRTHTVGTRLPNELGIYDMNGNVWEYGYFKRITPSPETRGGAYCYSHEYCELKHKSVTDISRGDSFTGFRVFRTVVNQTK